jgi:hypothetical protein
LGKVQMTLSKAHEAIGEFFCAFSNLERELGEAIKVVLGLRDHPAADAIVGFLRDFKRKTDIVRAGSQGAKRADGTDPDEKWKRDVAKLMDEVLGCNNPYRINLAHDYLEPHADGSVSLKTPGETPKTWTSENFSQKIANMNALANKVRTVSTDLTNLNIPVPTGWMSMDTYQPRRISTLPPGMGSGVVYTWPPPQPPDQQEQD